MWHLLRIHCENVFSSTCRLSFMRSDIGACDSDKCHVNTKVCLLQCTLHCSHSQSWTQCDTISLEIVKGALLIKDQICEYMDHGDELEQWCYLDFFLGTYDGKMLKNHDSNRGWPGNVRIPYQENCNCEGHCRILCTPSHNTMPYFPGHWFPSWQCKEPLLLHFQTTLTPTICRLPLGLLCPFLSWSIHIGDDSYLVPPHRDPHYHCTIWSLLLYDSILYEYDSPW